MKSIVFTKVFVDKYETLISILKNFFGKINSYSRQVPLPIENYSLVSMIGDSEHDWGRTLIGNNHINDHYYTNFLIKLHHYSLARDWPSYSTRHRGAGCYQYKAVERLLLMIKIFQNKHKYLASLKRKLWLREQAKNGKFDFIEKFLFKEKGYNHAYLQPCHSKRNFYGQTQTRG